MIQLLEGSCSLGLAGWLFLWDSSDTPSQDNTGHTALEFWGVLAEGLQMALGSGVEPLRKGFTW